MKTLSFDNKSLKKHSSSKYNAYGRQSVENCRKVICAVRDERKGVIGELFSVDGAGTFVLEKIEEYTGLIELADCCKDHYDFAGFDTPDEMMDMVMSTYPYAKEFFYHLLTEVFDLPEDE